MSIEHCPSPHIGLKFILYLCLFGSLLEGDNDDDDGSAQGKNNYK